MSSKKILLTLPALLASTIVSAGNLSNGVWTSGDCGDQPAIPEMDEPWKSKEDVRYVPLQPKEGDLAVYLQNNAWEIIFNNEKYIIVPQSAVLLLIRDEGLFE